MTLFTNLAILLILAIVSQQFMAANCQKAQGRKGRTDGKQEKKSQKEGQPPQLPIPPADKDISPKSQNRKDVFKGKFSSKDKTRCTWVATGDDAFVLGLNCEKGGERFDCEYVAKPSACPQYESNAKMYWKQIARALRKHKTLCFDTTSLVRAGMCRQAPRDAHLKLKYTAQSITPPPSTLLSGITSCPDKVAKKKLAEEYCGGNWSSVCNFFFSMVQGDEC